MATITEPELRDLVAEFRRLGGIAREKINPADGTVAAISIGIRPGQDHSHYRALGKPGAGWMPPIQAAEAMREAIQRHFSDHLEQASEIVGSWPAWKRGVLGG